MKPVPDVLDEVANASESGELKKDLAVEASVPVGACPLASILCTEELNRRPSRPAEFEKENSALASLVSALADSPRTILQTLANKVLEVLDADSAGLSLLTKDEKRFYWAAISGAWGPHIGGGTPRTFGPCGDVLDRNIPMLFTHWERRYPYLGAATPLAEEGLLVPFYVNGRAVGTIWAIAHDKGRKFDNEDLRLLESMGRFASAAYQSVESIEKLKLEIAAREKAEAEVRELARGLEAKIRRLVEANVVGIVMWNLEGVITGANDAFLNMVQYDREDLASGRVRSTDLTPPEWRSQDERALAGLKTTGVFQPFEKEYFRKDGSRMPILLGGALFEGSGNEGVAFVLDLSKQKRTEEALRSVEADLAHATRIMTMGEMLSSISHELNQPLGSISNYGNAARRLLAAQPKGLQEVDEALANIVAEAERASAVIGRIRALAKKTQPERVPLRMHEVIGEVLALANRELLSRNIVVRSEFAGELPLVRGDRIELQQVLLNLVTNGADAMRASNGSRTLLVTAQRYAPKPDTFLCVSVRDSGIGIRPEALERIFTAFYTTKPQGMGLGLAISRTIVNAHGGLLWAEVNNDGPGATFHFTLPAAA
jgi:PAS domain S-box-containing protein